MPEDTYDEILEFAYALAEDAGKLILEGSAKRWRAHQEYEVKKNPVDLVTETDQAVEDFIKAAIVAKYPSHKFIGEESSEGKAKPVLTDEYTWIVDPIDPFLNRIFSAAEGRGAFMNRTTPLPLTGGIPQPLTQLNQCLIAAEWGSERSADTMDKKINSFRKLNGDPDKGIDGGKFVHALRTTGATTCNLVCVAAGELDISWDAGCWAWDVAAAAVILKETGAFFHGGKELYARDAPIGEILMSRRYVAVRALPPTDTETSEQIQRRLATELYEAVEEWTTPSMKGY
ncbi:Protein qutG [Vanrija pseudolonga]|uniref:Protein qutG n=1 Tax=Vanrija pseudolonga TaxID=143232 RepID=A0AAF0Y7C6_9TREE|nr:Protein qutG [Vanrija pseudolonga]